MKYPKSLKNSFAWILDQLTPVTQSEKIQYNSLKKQYGNLSLNDALKKQKFISYLGKNQSTSNDPLKNKMIEILDKNGLTIELLKEIHDQHNKNNITK